MKPNENTEAATMPVANTTDLVLFRNFHYREISWRLFLICLLLSAALIVSVGLNFIQANARNVEFFATTKDGRVLPLIPLSQPNVSDAIVADWAKRQILNIFEFNFSNYKDHFRNIAQNDVFTKTALPEFMKALDNSGIITSIEKYKLIVVPSAGVPVIAKTGIKDGLFYWDVQMPLELLYKSGTKETSEKYVLLIAIFRTAEMTMNELDIQISRVVMRPQVELGK